jgi:hypothetical protein
MVSVKNVLLALRFVLPKQVATFMTNLIDKDKDVAAKFEGFVALQEKPL